MESTGRMLVSYPISQSSFAIRRVGCDATLNSVTRKGVEEFVTHMIGQVALRFVFHSASDKDCNQDLTFILISIGKTLGVYPPG